MVKKTYQFIVVIISFIIFNGCNTILLGTRQKVYVNSQPSGATINIDGRYYGKTPKVIRLKRKGREIGDIKTKRKYYIKIEKPGYSTFEKIINRKLYPLYFGNILFGGLVGLITDASSGAMYKLDAKEIVANLKDTTNNALTVDSLAKNSIQEPDSFILKQPLQWAAGITGNFIAANVNDPAYFSGGPNTEKRVGAIGLSIALQYTPKTAIRITHSRSFADVFNRDVITTAAVGNYPSGTIIHVNEKWWVDDTRIEMLFRLNRLNNNKFGWSFVTGTGLRFYWYEYNFDPYPSNNFPTEPRIITYDNKTKELDDIYFLLLAGLKFEYNIKKVGLFIEPCMETTFIPELEGGGENLSPRYRISIGADFKFGKKLRLKP